MHVPDILQEYYSLARGLYQTGPSHDFSHIERVYKLALHIGEAEGADLQVIGLAALFHDLARGVETESGGEVSHAVASAEQARLILIDKNLKPEIINRVCQSIASHRYRDHNPPESLEAKCLYDADKLDSLGAVGIARAYLWLGEHGGKLYEAPEVWRQIDFGADLPETDSLHREWQIKLKHLKDRLYTATARKMAMKRAMTMEKFLETMEREVQGEE